MYDVTCYVTSRVVLRHVLCYVTCCFTSRVVLRHVLFYVTCCVTSRVVLRHVLCYVASFIISTPESTGFPPILSFHKEINFVSLLLTKRTQKNGLKE